VENAAAPARACADFGNAKSLETVERELAAERAKFAARGLGCRAVVSADRLNAIGR
jgi:hypothetical protein